LPASASLLLLLLQLLMVLLLLQLLMVLLLCVCCFRTKHIRNKTHQQKDRVREKVVSTHHLALAALRSACNLAAAARIDSSLEPLTASVQWNVDGDGGVHEQ
jgi:hypothetical protein